MIILGGLVYCDVKICFLQFIDVNRGAKLSCGAGSFIFYKVCLWVVLCEWIFYGGARA